MEDLIEIWKDAPDYEGKYRISSFGNLINTNSGKLLNGYIGNDGYVKCTLYLNGNKHEILRHQLVAMAFLDHSPCGFDIVVNHKDGDRSNNKLHNLELLTTRENVVDGVNRSKNKSIPVGVRIMPKTGRWRALVYFNKKQLHLGIFESVDLALKAYTTAVAEINKNTFESYYDIVKLSFAKKSKHKGITWNNSTKRWHCQVRIQGKRKQLGRFSTEEDAYRSYVDYCSSTAA